MDKPLKSVPHGQCDARPTVAFLAAEHHRPLTSTKLYCLVTEAHVCEQLAQGRYLVVEQLGIEPATCRTQVRRRNHYTTKPPSALPRTKFWQCHCSYPLPLLRHHLSYIVAIQSPITKSTADIRKIDRARCKSDRVDFESP